eukprot:g28639.t1
MQDCLWSLWQDWSPCSKEIKFTHAWEDWQHRSRSIALEASHGGAGCQGVFQDFRSCEEPCPSYGQNCGFGPWTPWSDCSATCQGHHQRARSIEVQKQLGGSLCHGSLEDSRPCNEDISCITPEVDCEYQGWLAWSHCSRSPLNCDPLPGAAAAACGNGAATSSAMPQALADSALEIPSRRSDRSVSAYLGFGLQYALLTPFVLELGVPIQWASIIWLGGPITGMFVQPLVGRLSDARSTSSGGWAALTKRFGRRRPFLAASNNAIWVVSKSLTADVVAEAQWPEAFSVSTGATGLGLALGYVLGGVHWSGRLPWLKTAACNDAGGCGDLRFAFLLAGLSCVLANCCTLYVGTEPTRPSSSPPAWKVLRQNQALGSAYVVTLLAWLGWISLQMYQTEPHFLGRPNGRDYVAGVHAASRALVVNALLMTVATYLIPRAIRAIGKAKLWCLATLLTALLLASSLVIRKTHAQLGAAVWLALLGPVYGVQQTIPFLVVTEEAPKEPVALQSSGPDRGYLNVALCIPQLLISLLGGTLISAAGSDTVLFGSGAALDLLAAGICMRFLTRPAVALPASLPLACQLPDMAGAEMPIVGVDEAGRGPWAGPVVAAAVMAEREASASLVEGVTDSKKLNEAQRELVYEQLIKCPEIRWAVSTVSVKRIDQQNILEAAHQAMTRAVQTLRRRLPSKTDTSILVDGNLVPKKLQKQKQPCRALIGGDRLCFEIAAASVIAKVTRDRLMMKLDRRYPSYGFAAHKGYGTAAHQAALVKHGPCVEHRTSFEPIKGFVATGKWRPRATRAKGGKDSCSTSCGQGEQRRARRVVREAAHDGHPCEAGGSLEIQACQIRDCLRRTEESGFDR